MAYSKPGLEEMADDLKTLMKELDCDARQALDIYCSCPIDYRRDVAKDAGFDCNHETERE